MQWPPQGYVLEGFLLYMRVSFLIDGFNLYGSVVEVLKSKSINCKWLDVHSLLSSYLPLIDNKARLEEIYFFTAIQDYLKKQRPDKIRRHLDYIKCLESTGVFVERGKFKKKDVYYNNRNCKIWLLKHEEKETDVAVAVKLFELFHLNKCDLCAIVSGDTDLLPAVRTAQILFPAKIILFIIPYGRSHSKELSNVAPRSFEMNFQQYVNHLFPPNIQLADGTTISQPNEWR
jgi:uncharacterized LabA/DUF88 family protein